MISLLVLVPMTFVATAMSVFMGMLVAISTIVTLMMTVFIGMLITFGTAFISFLILIFS